MNTDRELLELAAKAAGYTLEEHIDADGLYWPWCLELEDNWNPLTDDGAALRLAVKLQLRVIPPEDEFGLDRASVRVRGRRDLVDAFDSDPYAATRRAIVRAAAEIGKEMK